MIQRIPSPQHARSARTAASTARAPAVKPLVAPRVAKSACACGGGCPRCQEKKPLQPTLAISQPGYALEQEADRVADQVLRMPKPSSADDAGTTNNTRQLLLRQAIAPVSALQHAPPAVHDVLRTSGVPLDRSTRDFFEPRFGRDLSEVRTHTDRNAENSASQISARAYTVGNDIVFGTGEYAPHTGEGRRLLAHELTHVVQQEGAGQPMVQRMARGTGSPPANWKSEEDGTFTLTVVPDDEIERVDAAIARVREVALDPESFSSCHQYFQEHCPDAPANVLSQVYKSALVWKLMNPTAHEVARGERYGTNIAYTQSGYDDGEEALAQTLMHELGHNCGISDDAEHYQAEMASANCMGRGPNRMAFQFAFNDETFMMMLTYRRILAEIASGHIRITAGGDLNITGIAAEITEAVEEEEPQWPAELFTTTLGIEGRTTAGFGGERFGGVFGRVETGFGVGRFMLREPLPDEAMDIAGSWVLQLTGGVEFAIPMNPSISTLSIEAGYRLSQPLTPDAERIHTFIIAPTFGFF